jgi:hypothetical protein
MPLYQNGTIHFDHAEREIETDKLFLYKFLGLPHTDVIGHRLPRTSSQMQEAFERLDLVLAEFLEPHVIDAANTAVVVTGDHGWRSVDTAVWPSGDVFRCWTKGSKKKTLPLPPDLGIRRYSDDGTLAVAFDGGALRVWTDRGREKDVARWMQDNLGEYLDPVQRVLYGDELDSYLSSRNSRHANWGSVVCFADEHVALCQKDWIEDAQTATLSLPVAEHGTAFKSDCNVPMWTHNVRLRDLLHNDFGNRIDDLFRA